VIPAVWVSQFALSNPQRNLKERNVIGAKVDVLVINIYKVNPLAADVAGRKIIDRSQEPSELPLILFAGRSIIIHDKG
jgi:hypothetical protein